MQINLTKPLVFFDLETTGLNVGKDKIVEISFIKVMPDGEEIERTELINPGIHIPEECSAIHGITDQDVADKPTFAEIADDLLAFIGATPTSSTFPCWWRSSCVAASASICATA